MKRGNRLLSNGKVAKVILCEKNLQIISQNETHISIVILYFSSVVDEIRNIFRIEKFTIVHSDENQFVSGFLY
jgi:hypothetical protein